MSTMQIVNRTLAKNTGKQINKSVVSIVLHYTSTENGIIERYWIFALQWVTARERFSKAAELMDAEQRMKKSMWGQFWSAHQRFFKYLCISAKVQHCVELAREAVKNGKVSLSKESKKSKILIGVMCSYWIIFA